MNKKELKSLKVIIREKVNELMSWIFIDNNSNPGAYRKCFIGSDLLPGPLRMKLKCQSRGARCLVSNKNLLLTHTFW